MLWSAPMSVSASCSGFVAESTGYIVTAGHCVDPETGRDFLIRQFVADIVEASEGQYTADDLLPDALQTWTVEGLNTGSTVPLDVAIFQQGAASGIEVQNELYATVVDARMSDEGDVALLKVQTDSPMAALEVSDTTPEVGSEVAAMGFPGNIGATVDSSSTPSFKTAKVSALQTIGGAPFVQLDTATVAGMSGGPVVNGQGQVVAIVAKGPARTSEGGDEFDLAASQETIRALLKRNGVDPTLTQTDYVFREGIQKFFDGDYVGAAASFDAVLAVVPSHASAQKFRAKAMKEVEKNPTPASVAPPTSDPTVSERATPGVTPGVLVILLVLGSILMIAGAVAAFFMLRKRFPRPFRRAATASSFDVIQEDQSSSTEMGRSASAMPETCPACGASNEADSRFCRLCSAPIRSRQQAVNGSGQGV